MRPRKECTQGSKKVCGRFFKKIVSTSVNTKICNYIILLFVLFICSTQCFATHFYNATLCDLIKSSDLVFFGEVKNTGRNFFGYSEATISTNEVIKGAVTNEIFVKYGSSWFSSETNIPVLVDGKKYLFFVVKIDNELQLSGISSPTYYLVDNGEVLCGDEKISVKECIDRGVKCDKK